MLRLAFGSCNKQYKSQEYWDDIVNNVNPNMFLWMGDVVYAVNNSIDGNDHYYYFIIIIIIIVRIKTFIF